VFEELAQLSRDTLYEDETFSSIRRLYRRCQSQPINVDNVPAAPALDAAHRERRSRTGASGPLSAATASGRMGDVMGEPQDARDTPLAPGGRAPSMMHHRPSHRSPSRPPSVAAASAVGIAGTTPTAPAHPRAACGARRLRRQCARAAPIGERATRAGAAHAAAQHGDDDGASLHVMSGAVRLPIFMERRVTGVILRPLDRG